MCTQFTAIFKIFLFLAPLVLLIGCKQEEKPARLLTEEEMTRILMDIYIGEEKINRLNLRRDSAEKIFEQAAPLVFRISGVSDSLFRESYNYYVAHPRELEKIYSILVDSLNLREQKLTASQPPK
jgi:hypothetical protein